MFWKYDADNRIIAEQPDDDCDDTLNRCRNYSYDKNGNKLLPFVFESIEKKPPPEHISFDCQAEFATA